MEFQDRPAWRYQWRTLLLAVLLVAGAFVWADRVPVDPFGPRVHRMVAAALGGLAVLTLLVGVYRRYRFAYRIRDGVIEARRGILARRVDALRLRNLRHVEVNQGVWQRLLGVGDLRFASSGTEGTEIVFRGIRRPERLRRSVQESVDSSEETPVRSGDERRDAASESRFCTECGEAVDDTANYCSHCGASLSGEPGGPKPA